MMNYLSSKIQSKSSSNLEFSRIETDMSPRVQSYQIFDHSLKDDNPLLNKIRDDQFI